MPFTHRTLFPIAALCAAIIAPPAHAASGLPVNRTLPQAPSIEQTISLEELVHPDRFGWPARFTCRRDLGGAPLTVMGTSVADLNAKLLKLDVYPEDCRHGFAIRSLRSQEGKLDEVIGLGAAQEAD